MEYMSEERGIEPLVVGHGVPPHRYPSPHPNLARITCSRRKVNNDCGNFLPRMPTPRPRSNVNLSALLISRKSFRVRSRVR